ncbi:unnamed protein product [Anisakis simplex]|uniref:TMEM135_C_rich domain-containing protein n=1 Tax=Anisakis simplex TaxID=6269 RepID=A0A0M3JVS9_ANISI|nr:unnamed protein product [Anisakis simplex]
MSVLSKLFGDVLGFKIQTANCYELHHTWNPSCNGAIRDAMWDGFSFSFRTYATLYIIAAFLSKRDIRKIDWVTTFKDTFRSTVFLMTNLAAYMWFMCRLRRLLGFSILPTMGLINGLLASWLAILVESPKRRPLLSLYLTNLASETAYRQLANHGYVRLLSNGQVILFGIGLSGLLYLFRRKQLGRNLSSLLSFALCLDNANEELVNVERLRAVRNGYVQRLLRWVLFMRTMRVKHHLCTHTHSCVSKSVEGSHCLLNRLLGKDTPQTQMLCGGFSGLAMLFYPNVSIAMYILWKFIEAFYFALVSEGYARTIPYGDILLYTLSTGYVLWSVTIEPHAIRKGYWDFLSKLTGGKVALLNRRLYDVYGYRSSTLFPDFAPELNQKFISINPEA